MLSRRLAWTSMGVRKSAAILPVRAWTGANGGTIWREAWELLFELKWIDRLPDSRAVRVTDAGRKGLIGEFGLKLTENP